MRSDKGQIPLNSRFGSDPRGSILVIVLLVMLAVTILGVLSIHTSAVELQIAGTERRMREAFYLAEAAAVEGVQRLVNAESTDMNERYLAWHHSQKDIEAKSIDFRDPLDWDVDRIAPDNGIFATVGEDVFIAAVEWRVATGSSLISTESRLYVNRVYGLCSKNNADTLIEIGYKSRY